jgi:uncharacterized protein
MTHLAFPTKVLDAHAAVLGKTGAGKSSAMRHVVEYLLDHNKRVCVIDPKGDWWGLKASADGKSAGYPVITFGDFKGDYEADVPINEQSGKHVAELITSGNRPCVIGFRGWFTAHMLFFWIEFAKTLFHTNEGELYLIIDEAQNFAPKGRLADIEGKAGTGLHWTNRLLAEGRGLGINIWVGSQRPQKVHNDTLDGCETLVAMRTVHPAARNALTEWMKGSGDKKAAETVLNAIGEMPRGEAYVWSPEIGFGPKHVAFPMFTTFDSFAPPQLQKKIHARTWADVDLEEVKTKLAKVIEEQKANDPKELKREVSRLRSELMKREGMVAATTQPKIEIKEIPVLREGELEKIEKLQSGMVKLGSDWDERMKVFWEGVRGFQSSILSNAAALNLKNRPTQSHRPHVSIEPKSTFARPPARQPTPVSTDNGEFEPAPRHIALINALAFYANIGVKPINKNRHAAFVGRSNDGGYRNDLSAMRTAGIIEYPTSGMVELTAHGRSLVTEIPNIARQSDLHAIWLKRLPPRQAELLRTLLSEYPESMPKDQLAETVGRTNDGGFRNDLSALRTLGTIDYPNKGYVIASENLFPPIPA